MGRSLHPCSHVRSKKKAPFGVLGYRREISYSPVSFWNLNPPYSVESPVLGVDHS